MKLKSLFKLISPLENFQLFSSKTGECLTPVTYIDDCGCWEDVECLFDNRVAGMRPALDNDKEPYLAIMLILADGR